ncbi:cysteine desulfurase family protein [Dyadobacter frigoris]|uniref:cysteine desulfurase n=1 Tax=Dyadobacter frigoris TaxID=2576211 RepID=A0A4U6D983_9BACT|nr:cysteine desulfurase family protein [Dyadobacter frigoris]TKT93336.1 cysteine desulfurase [Dyadobacter frigoris]
MKENYIYLDNNSTTPLDPRVLEKMMPYLTYNQANASSSHQLGRISNNGVEKARANVANLVNCNSEDLIFTSGATESINLALRGILFKQSLKNRNHVITVSTEHPAVLETCAEMELSGINVTYLDVDHDGLINLEELEARITPQTALICVMLANNETGVIQPVQAIAELSHKNGALFMTDATQAVGRLPVDVVAQEIDILAFSAHKFYGPKGIGCLYVNPGLNIKPIIFGGGQERGLRSGTLNVPGIIGMGAAAKLSEQAMESDRERVGLLTAKLETALLSIENTFLNGNKTQRLYNTINICFDKINNEDLLINLNTICVSNGSACSSSTIEPSHVLLKMGLTREQADSSIRLSLGRFTTSEEVEITISTFKRLSNQLRITAG